MLPPDTRGSQDATLQQPVAGRRHANLQMLWLQFYDTSEDFQVLRQLDGLLFEIHSPCGDWF